MSGSPGGRVPSPWGRGGPVPRVSPWFGGTWWPCALSSLCPQDIPMSPVPLVFPGCLPVPRMSPHSGGDMVALSTGCPCSVRSMSPVPLVSPACPNVQCSQNVPVSLWCPQVVTLFSWCPLSPGCPRSHCPHGVLIPLRCPHTVPIPPSARPRCCSRPGSVPLATS